MIYKLKKLVILGMTMLMCLGISGCGISLKEDELPDAEVVTAFLEAYQKGDYEAMKPFIDADNKLHSFFAVLNGKNGNGMEEVFEKVHEMTKDFTFTAEAVEGKERWGEVLVKIQTKDISVNILNAMGEAIASEVANGDDSFENVPAWMMAAFENYEPIEEEITVHVGNRDGVNVMDTNTNRNFFDIVNGGFYYYIFSNMTTCENKYDEFEIFSKGDEILGMIETAKLGDMSDEELQAYIEPFNIKGVSVQGLRADDGVAMKLGVDFETASSFKLAELGVVSDRITAGSNSHLSLKTTIEDFEGSAMTCKTIYGITRAKEIE